MRILLFILLGLSVLLVNCRKNYYEEDLFGNWEVEKIIPLNDSAYIPTESYILEFKSDDSYRLSLDVNSCSGDYNVQNNSKITFKDVGCTEACCDSEAAQMLSNMLKDLNRYEIDGRKLILLGEGKVILKAQ